MDKVKKVLDYFIVALCGSVSAFVIKNFGLVGIRAIAYPALAASITYFILTAVVYSSKRSLFVRSYIDDRTRYEGNWIQQYDKNHKTYYGLITIKYSYDKDNYSLTGLAVDEMGETHATWNSNILEFYSHLNEMHCSYRARVHGHEFTGFSSYTFNLDGKKYNDGIGYFIDMEPVQCFNFISLRVNDHYLKELSGVTSVVKRQEIIKQCKSELAALRGNRE